MTLPSNFNFTISCTHSTTTFTAERTVGLSGVFGYNIWWEGCTEPAFYPESILASQFELKDNWNITSSNNVSEANELAVIKLRAKVAKLEKEIACLL